jgi:hypothetical protein
VLLAEILIGQLFPTLTFMYGALTITNRIIAYFSFCGILFCLLLLFRVDKDLRLILGILIFSFFFINSCSEIFPIDTTTEPVDIAILNTEGNGNKLIVRQYENVKTNEKIRDTVLVKDFFIFRELIDAKP